LSTAPKLRQQEIVQAFFYAIAVGCRIEATCSTQRSSRDQGYDYCSGSWLPASFGVEWLLLAGFPEALSFVTLSLPSRRHEKLR